MKIILLVKETKMATSAYKSTGKCYTVGFSSTMNTSLITRMDFGATYNIKFAGAWVDVRGEKLRAAHSIISATLQLATGPVVDLADLKNDGEFGKLVTNGVNFSKSVAFVTAAPVVGVIAGIIKSGSGIASSYRGIKASYNAWRSSV